MIQWLKEYWDGFWFGSEMKEYDLNRDYPTYSYTKSTTFIKPFLSNLRHSMRKG
jgi:hypothetical protein